MTSIAVIIRFKGDADDLLTRFEEARRNWMAAQGDDYERPTFYAACRADDGIAVLSGWDSAAGHRAFGQGLHQFIHEAGLPEPDQIERLRIESFGWE
jgi:hypothetical protein